MKIQRRVISLLLVLAFLLQPFTFTFSPVSRVFAQDAELEAQKQIKEVREEFKAAKEEIDEIEPVELGFWRSASLKLGWLFSKDRKSTAVSHGHHGYHTGLTPEEAKENKEWNDANNYVARIEEANEQIEESKEYFGEMDSSINDDKITSLLDTRELEKMLDQALTAQAKYQDNIKQAGEDLLVVSKSLADASSALGKAAAALSIAALICGVTVAGLPAVPVIKALATACSHASLTLSITSGKLEAVGESLIESADEGITSDKEFGKLLDAKVSKSFISDGVSYGAGKLIGAGLDKTVTSHLKTWNSSRPLNMQYDSNQMDMLDWIAKKPIKDALAPLKSKAVDATTDALTTPIPPPSDKPGLNLNAPGRLSPSLMY